MPGILGNTFADDPGYAAPQGGILSGYGPMAGNQKAALLFAGLRDAISSFSGAQPTDYSGQQGQQVMQQNQLSARGALNKKIQAAYASGDMNTVRQALMEAAGADPEAVGHIVQALQFGQPKIESYGEGQNVFSVEPLTGTRTQIQTGHEKPPSGYKDGPDGSYSAIPGGPADPKNPLNFKPPPGYQYDQTGTKLGLVPGYLGAAGDLAAARRKPDAPAVSIGAQNPAAMFRRGR